MDEYGSVELKSWQLCRRAAVTMLAVMLAACGGSGGGAGSTPARGDLVSVTSSSTINTITVNVVLAALAVLGVDTSALSGTYGVSFHRIVYKTVTPDGRLINASGVVGYPLKLNNAPQPAPELSACHPVSEQ